MESMSAVDERLNGNTTVEDIARVCHEANYAYCWTLGDRSQVPWDDAPEWQRASAIAGVMLIIRNPSTTPEQSHENWLEQKRREGWIYGETKDAIAKTHPCFRPYHELPPEQRIKDHLFGAVVRAIVGITENKQQADGDSRPLTPPDALRDPIEHE